jgi:2-oxoglutarate dehydrogenase E1 component
VNKEEIDQIQKKVNSILNEEFLASKDYVPKRRDWLSSHWSGFKSPEQLSRIRNTGYVFFSVWKREGGKGFNFHCKLAVSDYVYVCMNNLIYNETALLIYSVKPDILKNVGKAITVFPENFKPHRAVKKVYDQRAQMIETGEGIDWAVAEALAFATLLVEGNHVRLSGQDVERGTFSHRHAVVHDQETGEKYCPLDNVIMNQNEELFTVSNR